MTKLTGKQLAGRVDFCYRFMAPGNTATKSVYDANANSEAKNIATLAAEMNKDIDIQVNRYALAQRIKKLFGKHAMKEFYTALRNHEIYSHDESSIFSKPYCCAIDLHPFIEKGMVPLSGDSKAPQHLSSFCGSYINLIFAISSQFAGAVADVSFLGYFHYFANKDYGKDYLATNKREIENAFQHIFYSLNQPAAARGYQSVFYNTSIFDKYYFEALFGQMLMPNGEPLDWDGVNALQHFFMKWFNEERTKALLTFPVVTAAYLTEEGKPKDETFKKFLAAEMAEGNSFFHYNSDSVDSLASCCFDGHQEVVTDDHERISFKDLWDASEFENPTKIYNVLCGKEYNAGRLVRLPGKPMYAITTANGAGLIATEDHIHATMDGDKKTTRLTTTDWLECADENGLGEPKYTPIRSIRNIEGVPEWVYCFEMLDQENPYFTLANGITTHNCRLRNAIDKNQFAYTLGGTGIATGSKKVFSLNINRMVQDGRDILKEVAKLHRYLVAYDDILYEMQGKGMLPVYDAGYISLDKQYLTIGVNGVVEAAEFLGLDISYNPEYIKWLQDLFGTIMKANSFGSEWYSEAFGRKIKFNTELVPAENLGHKFAQWDKKARHGLFGFFRTKYKVPREVYNSYLYRVEDARLDFIDKLKIHGKEVLQYLDGGSACHLNFTEIPSKESWERVIDLAAFYGCNYWTWNVRSTVCNECGYISKFDRQTCEKCGSGNVDWATRIIGYLKRITSFSEARQKEAGVRFYHKP